MGLLDTDIAAIFSAALSGLYLDATLHAGTGEPIYDELGNVIGYSGGDTAIKAQVDQASEAMREASGFAEGDVRLIILAQGIGDVTTDMQVTVRGATFSLYAAELDAAASHWICRARET
ncbi:hypothetical protein [Croceibacterium aestuarii]|uniref:hypothetical protein n=1 Tax=Croceibacterium aestuarii TaxID=3064139 RepID=UPI00272E35A3|nr:hypothetical protein [Croceibacterium sp. D39]